MSSAKGKVQAKAMGEVINISKIPIDMYLLVQVVEQDKQLNLPLQI